MHDNYKVSLDGGKIEFCFANFDNGNRTYALYLNNKLLILEGNPREVLKNIAEYLPCVSRILEAMDNPTSENAKLSNTWGLYNVIHVNRFYYNLKRGIFGRPNSIGHTCPVDEIAAQASTPEEMQDVAIILRWIKFANEEKK